MKYDKYENTNLKMEIKMRITIHIKVKTKLKKMDTGQSCAVMVGYEDVNADEDGDVHG